MTKRILRAILLVSLAAALACAAITIGVLYEYFTSIQRSALAVQTSLAAQGMEKDGRGYFDGLDTGAYRLTWVAKDGTVLYDNIVDPATMENHAAREEIRQALETGTGESERTSSTLAEKTLYQATRLTDGTVLRVSITQYTVFTLVMGILSPLCIVLAAALLLATLLAWRAAKRIAQPLNQLDLDHPLENDAYEELSPLLTRIERQHRQINGQLLELKRRQDEFTAITENMSEGLILLSDADRILSINRAAMELFDTDSSSVGQDILTVNRSLAMQNLLVDGHKGLRSEAVLPLKGGEYQINASPVHSDGALVGLCILTFDITEKALSEQQRREFSANVSHELKTPLHSIMGCAELIENHLAKPEDMPRFVGRIRSESARLVTLIDDIIRLSQLDEGGELPREMTDLQPLAQEAAEALAQAAQTRQVTLECAGESAPVLGVPRLLYEILYNLCDNGIKYNVPQGHVRVETGKTSQGAAFLTVSDTGIGIPPEAQHRVFERFYRVDKSHSKETGGTGLGLSIVKHAVHCHYAKLSLDSQLGKGTTIRVEFPPAPKA